MTSPRPTPDESAVELWMWHVREGFDRMGASCEDPTCVWCGGTGEKVPEHYDWDAHRRILAEANEPYGDPRLDGNFGEAMRFGGGERRIWDDEVPDHEDTGAPLELGYPSRGTYCSCGLEFGHRRS